MLGSLTRVALRKGIIGRSRPWLLLGASLLAVRIVRYAAVGRPVRVFRGELAPDDTLRITSRQVS